MTSCAVIIVNYNTGQILAKAVERALSNEAVACVVVVDNASQDDSMALLPENPRLEKHYRQSNPGFGASCNYAVKRIGHRDIEHVLLLNPDCLIEIDTVQRLINAYHDEQQAGIIGCLVNNPDGTEQRAARRRLPTFLRAVKSFTGIEKLARLWHGFAGVNLNHQRMPRQAQRVEAISGALMMVKWSVFQQLNGFDEAYPLHFEDLDLFKRARDFGHDVIFDPCITVIHHQGTSSNSNPQVAHMKKIGALRYFRKHCSYFSYQVIRLLNVVR